MAGRFWGNRGTRWQDVDNTRLYRLAMDRAYEVEPHMEDAEEDHDGSIEVIFGSTGACLTLRLVDSDAVGLFAYGYCTLLAYAIHMKTSLPLVVFSVEDEKKGWHGHAGILVGDDKILDITGFSTEAEIMTRYKKVSKGQVVSLDEFKSLAISNEMFLENPLSFLDELEQLVVQDFADHLIKEYSLQGILTLTERNLNV